MYVPNDAVANFTVIQNQFSPEFGHSAGGQFNQVLVSGTNTIHGRVYEYFQNRNLNAIDQEIANVTPAGQSPVNPRYDNNRFGGQVGGPIIKNKLFYFANFEYNPIGQAAVPSSPACAPTAAGWAAALAVPGVSANNINGFAAFATAPAQATCGGVTSVTVNDYVTHSGNSNSSLRSRSAFFRSSRLTIAMTKASGDVHGLRLEQPKTRSADGTSTTNYAPARHWRRISRLSTPR